MCIQNVTEKMRSKFGHELRIPKQEKYKYKRVPGKI
jgi:hypothetical protein